MCYMLEEVCWWQWQQSTAWAAFAQNFAHPLTPAAAVSPHPEAVSKPQFASVVRLKGLLWLVCTRLGSVSIGRASSA